MVLVEDQRFAMLPRHMSNDPEDFVMSYPDPPPQGVFPTSMDMTLPESYNPFPRHSQDGYPMGYEANTMYEAQNYLFNGRSSPGMYQDDSEMRLPSSNLSTASATSSTMGSPLSSHGQIGNVPDWAGAHGLGVSPAIVSQGDYGFSSGGNDYSFMAPNVDEFPQFEYPNPPKAPGFVDPSLINPDMGRPMGLPGYETAYPAQNPYPGSPSVSASPQLRNSSTSPFMHNGYQPYSPFPAPIDPQGRRTSVVSFHSGYSNEQTISGDESKEKQRCPHPDCGKTFKDLKAHMLTHQTERPEKCPIQTCDYHVKGFARKYDKNRHTLTHYKGTMVCGFCPGSGSAAEKSFNRADVFKRHLTAVHGVEQTAPNSRKKTTLSPGSGSGSGAGGKKLASYAPDATGKCSTCSATFSNAQDFYEHLDDCVLRIVQQEDPAEAINAARLAEVENDRDVHDTLEKNQLPTASAAQQQASADEDDEECDEEMCEDGDEDDEKDEDFKASSSSSPTKKHLQTKGNPVNGVQKSRGLTHSRGGVPLPARSRGRKNRRDYPSSWGFDKGQMTMKKRVMAVFDGPRRLAKDDMMLSTEHEVRVRLSDGKSYVTDLDVQTLRRAEGFLDATDAEKGVWVSDDPSEEDVKKMLRASA